LCIFSKLRHPNIVPFLGACVEPEFCLITEFMERGSLFDVLAKNPDLPWYRKVSFCWDIAKGVLYLHTRNPPIIHRDIKSLNILVSFFFLHLTLMN
jgi:serine/threonine protein kinase